MFWAGLYRTPREYVCFQATPRLDGSKHQYSAESVNGVMFTLEIPLALKKCGANKLQHCKWVHFMYTTKALRQHC